jgi:hypothetical protein
MLESDGLDPTTEECVPLFQPIQRGVQLRDNCIGFIGDDDQFDIDLFVEHPNDLQLPILCLPRLSCVFGTAEQAAEKFIHGQGMEDRG